ncbi:MAG TPA: ImmA/IrrE family metallo-endopeptidase [Polyangia bacterium]|nr:ImmA/IrrE family metallo-endopeptidase [Polyangia bacterium]
MARSLSPLLPSFLTVVLAVVLTLASAGGCAQPSPGDSLHFDPCQPLILAATASASQAETDGISAGIALWNRVAHSHLSMIVDGAGSTSAPGATVPINFQAAAAPSHGFYDAERGEVFINTDLTDSQRAITIAHEVGHSFGLAHVADSTRLSVMNPGNLDTPPTSDDVEALAALWGRCPEAPR